MAFRGSTRSVIGSISSRAANDTTTMPVTAFTQRVAARLHAENSRWGRRRNSSGSISNDTVAYRIGGTWIAP